MFQQTVEAMFRDDHRPAFVHEARRGCQHEPGAIGIQLRSRLVEDHQAWPHGKCGGQRDPLALASAERPHGSPGEILDTCCVQRFFDPAANLAPRHRRVFQPEGDFAVDDVVDGLQLGILKDEAHVAGHLASGRRDDIEPHDVSTPGDPSAVEVRHKAVEGPEQRRLAAA